MNLYTTKEPGKGTGLGLAQVYGIAKSHDGHINVSSSIGSGSTFAIYLPAIASQRPKFPNTEPFMLVRGTGETLLVVEDEMATRQALKDGLTLINYHVIATIDGVQALSYLNEHPHEVKLVLSDVVMPEMGGIELLRAIRNHVTFRPQEACPAGFDLSSELAYEASLAHARFAAD